MTALLEKGWMRIAGIALAGAIDCAPEARRMQEPEPGNKGGEEAAASASPPGPDPFDRVIQFALKRAMPGEFGAQRLDQLPGLLLAAPKLEDFGTGGDEGGGFGVALPVGPSTIARARFRATFTHQARSFFDCLASNTTPAYAPSPGFSPS